MAASHHSQTSQPSYSSPRGLPLLRLPRLRIVPFLGLAIIHRPSALGVAWSTWSTTNFHRKSTVHGEADSWVQAATRKCLLITREIIILHLTAGTHRTGHLISQKKCFLPTARTHLTGQRISRKNVCPLTAGTHRTGHRISRKKCSPRYQLGPTGSASLLRAK